MSFVDDLEKVTQQVLRARTHFDVWWEYASDETKPNHAEVTDQNPYFFMFDAHAHFTTAVVYLARLYETNPKTLNLSTLLRAAEQESACADCVGVAQAIFRETDDFPSKISIVRSNTVVHTSPKLSEAETFEMAELTPFDLRRATDSALHVVNELRPSFNLSTWEFRDYSVRQLRRILDRLSS